MRLTLGMETSKCCVYWCKNFFQSFKPYELDHEVVEYIVCLCNYTYVCMYVSSHPFIYPFIHLFICLSNYLDNACISWEREGGGEGKERKRRMRMRKWIVEKMISKYAVPVEFSFIAINRGWTQWR